MMPTVKSKPAQNVAGIPSPTERAVSTAKFAHGLAWAAIVIIALELAARFGAASLANLVELRQTQATPGLIEQISAILRVWVLALPSVLLLCALDHLRKALGEYAEARFFSPASARGVRHAGEYAVAGMIAAIVGAPTLQAWISGEPGGVTWRMDSPDVAMLAFALFVMAVGRVLDLAVAIKAENDEIV